jgi:hypothetical protein
MLDRLSWLHTSMTSMMGSTRLKNFVVAEATSVTAVSTDCMGIPLNWKL